MLFTLTKIIEMEKKQSNIDKIELLKKAFDLEEVKVEKSIDNIELLAIMLKNREVSLIAGRPGMGNLTLALNLALNLLKKTGDQTLFYTLNSGLEKIDLILKSLLSNISYPNYTYFQQQEKQENKIIEELPLYIERATNFENLDEFITNLTEKIIKYKINLVIIDNLQIIKFKVLKNSSSRTILENKLSFLKLLIHIAKQYNVKIILLSDLLKNIELRKGHKKRPVLQDVVDIGLPLNMFKSIFLAYRPEYYRIPYWDFNNQLPTEKTLEVTTYQGLETNCVLFEFNRETFMFKDLVQDNIAFTEFL